MITIIARLKILPGKESEAEKALSDMVAAVEANEPGALAYIMHRSQRDPTDVTVFEVYADGEAFSTHSQSAHMAALQGKLAQLADLSAVKIDRLERIAGFVRPPA
jgi:quinol monooxygenase YgiN